MRKKQEQVLVAQIAANDIFGQFRYFKKDDGEIWWVVTDVGKILGIKNIRQNLADFPSDEKADVCITYTSSNGVTQNRKVLCVNEPGLYRLIFMSRKPEAEKFKHWIFHEVLPSIRKTGTYSLPRKSLPEKKIISQGELLVNFFELYPDAEPEITGISYSEDENGNVITHYHVGFRHPDGNLIDPEEAAKKILERMERHS